MADEYMKSRETELVLPQGFDGMAEFIARW